ncbi:uncharacterized protein PHACADRAFT_85172 [Phanerochaete carnosa HHB-10118-sp]|uniref:MARVEL domain-containing protein n=1 Tax=Phanerochaete carnosa (strain HHB-10118-sp) TaxID=650164 RepID=K5W908_PHACS|nr:uncharacterized protein PHACADRAFT_85172 [Phanerochaete carnosa HHB-10118-sp]EKM60413.1 hypothetical protein PHACADRAFT_85172 [Phanerochaete carnosa HHB-10118-sp]
MPAHWIGRVRLGVFSAVSVFAVIVLRLAAGLITITKDEFDGYYSFAPLAVAAAVLTIITLPVMLIIDFFRRGAVTSMILVEIVWLRILWILWLAIGSWIASQLRPDGSCGIYFAPNWLTTTCTEAQATAAFAFLTWIALLAYWIVLLIMALISATKGSCRMWYTSIKGADFASDTAEYKGAAATPVMQQGYPPAAPYPVGPQPDNPGYQWPPEL